MALSHEDVERIAHRTAQEVLARSRDLLHDSLVLHSVPYAYGSPGIVWDERRARSSPCRCIEYRPGKRLCFSKGIIGALSEGQKEEYCPTTVPLKSPGLEKRLAQWIESVETCQTEIADIPRGERLEPWLRCMGRELKAHGIEA